MTWVFFATAALAGLFAGSFLNVVVHRGPRLWGLCDAPADAPDGDRGTLWAPRSYCPHCKASIERRDLIPLASYFLLGGKCRSCGAPISPRYPILEVSGAAAAMLSAAMFGFTFDALFASLLLLMLAALAAIDAETGYLPDALTLPLLWLGLLANLNGRFTSLEAAVIGAAAGYLAFRVVAETYRLMRGREGLGGGDAKLLAAFGAWGGWTLLAPSVLAGAVIALIGVAAARLSGRPVGPETPISFGPALCLGGAAVFIAAQAGILFGLF